MQRVAETVGITSMAIYHHFSSRDALLDTITGPEFAKLLSYMHRTRSPGGVEDRLLAIAGVRYRYGTLAGRPETKR